MSRFYRHTNPSSALNLWSMIKCQLDSWSLTHDSSAIAKRSYSDSSALYFGKLKSCLLLPKSFPDRYSPSSLSNSDFLREELQHLIKRTMESGRLWRQCANCGNSQPCCGQTILEAVSSVPPPS